MDYLRYLLGLDELNLRYGLHLPVKYVVFALPCRLVGRLRGR